MEVIISPNILSLSLSAHDSDVKEANKQKCLQPSAQPAQMVYPVQGQSMSLHQYMQRPNTQYMQQNCQPVVMSTQGPATYVTHTASMQVSTAPLHGLTQTQTMDAKVNMPSRAYQVNSLYPCTAPCFDRWWHRTGKHRTVYTAQGRVCIHKASTLLLTVTWIKTLQLLNSESFFNLCDQGES